MTALLSPGVKLGRYQIRSQIGAGGMGVVYRAHDEKLNRDVAIKVLPAEFSQNVERLHRFEQEAQATGLLNHPNILAVYDVGTHDGAPFVVSELLEGETLRDRIGDGPLVIRKAIDIGIQMSRGLSAAHEKGIVHRDLKPDNVFLTSDERVKILDFGLAKLTQPAQEEIAQTDIATRRVHTDPGTVMGTAGYMSPEQVRGRATDHRSDIFSLGAVLYEMVSGQRAFRGDSAIETLNAILKEEPPELSSTNSNVAPAVERVIWHCLEKAPERRFQSASDVAFALESVSGASSQSEKTLISSSPTQENIVTKERLIWAAACLLLLVTAAGLAFVNFMGTKKAAHSIHLALAVPEAALLPWRITVSPNGQYATFLANNSDGKRFLWIRSLDSITAQPIEGTEGASSPFWSPDSRFIAYFANRKLIKIEAQGGRPQTLCDVADISGGAWSSNGTILFAGAEGLYRVPAQGGAPTLATKIDSKEEAHRWPYFLPDGKHFVFLGDAPTTKDHHIRFGSLDSQDTQILFGAISRVAYAPPGYLLYVNQGALVAQPFDASALKITGEPDTVTEHVAEVGSNHEFDFSVSNDGVLAYQIGSSNSQLVWISREGKKLESVGEPGNYSDLMLSPDASRAAVPMMDADGRVADIWLLDIGRKSFSKFTFEPSGEGSPVWSPDGKKIVFSSNRIGNVDIFMKSASGTGDDQLVFKSEAEKFPVAWSKNGDFILFENWPQKSSGSIWQLSLTEGAQPKPVLQSNAFDQTHAHLSPDDHFIAYTSDESGRLEVYVQPFPTSGEKWQISTNGGDYPSWRGDGRELFYITQEGHLMSAEIKTAGKFESGVPRQLFQANIKNTTDGWCYAAAADGQRFLINSYLENNNSAPLTVVLNWTADLHYK